MQPEETARNPRGSGGRGNVGFAEDTQRATGESKRRLQEHVSRAETLGPDIHAVVGTSLDRAGEQVVTRASRMPPPSRYLCQRTQQVGTGGGSLALCASKSGKDGGRPAIAVAGLRFR